MAHFEKKTVNYGIDRYITFTIGFECNNNCISCMLRGCRNKLRAVTFKKFKELLDKVIINKKFTSIIFSGAEVTLKKNLVDFVEYARDLHYFNHIRIQTNARKLSDINFCVSLVRAGVDEFYVSLNGSSPKIHESLTRTSNSFKETIGGLKNLSRSKTTVITNTVVTNFNYADLPYVADIFLGFDNIVESQFWNFVPPFREDQFNLIPKLLKIIPFLKKVVCKYRKHKRGVSLSCFPTCLSSKFNIPINRDFPETIIDKNFYLNFSSEDFQCCYSHVCTSEKCAKLSRAYIDKWGWEKRLLRPICK